MSEILKENWFVVLIAIIIVGFVGYFIYDNNKYNVSSKTSEGAAVLATIAEEDITADEVYEQLGKNDDALLFYLYRNAVINEAVATTDELKSQAKNMQLNIEANASSSDDANYKVSIASELGTYGYSSFDQLNDYCLTYAKEKQLDTDYIEAHFDDLKGAVEEKKARTISVLSMGVTNAEELTEEEQKKKDSIDKQIKEESFAKAATAFSEDTATAGNKGFYGYIDADTTEGLNADVLAAALELDKDGTSDWITVVDENYGTVVLYKVHVDEVDLKTIYDNGSETTKNAVLSAMLSDNDNLDLKIIEDAASKLTIEFKDETTQKRIESYILTMKGEK